MASLADPGQSRAVLVGVSSYQHLEALNAVANNLTDLADELTAENVWGLPADNCVVVLDPKTAAEMLDPLVVAAQAATDTLLFYFAGHGLTPPTGSNLHLALPGSIRKRMYTAVSYDHVREAMLTSRASRRVAILDCCYSGLALGQMGDPTVALVNEASAAGTFVLAAAAENRTAQAPAGWRNTAFTAELLETIRHGIPAEGPLLDLNSIYLHLDRSLGAKNLPVPQARDRNTGGRVTLFRNQAYRPPAPAAFPEDLAAHLESRYPAVRIGAVHELGSWLASDDGARAMTAKHRLEHIAETDNPAVVAAARAYLASPERPAPVTIPQAQNARKDETATKATAKAPEHVRPSQSRAARLLAEAKRITQSITDKDQKGYALIAVAEAVTSSDPDQAGQLLAEAERIAQYITDEKDKRKLLQRLAVDVAATDPDRAEALARSIADKDTEAFALCDVAKAVAATDPDRAERIARSMTNYDGISGTEAAIAVAVAATDPDRGERIARSLLGGNGKDLTLRQVAEAVAATDPDRAERIVGSITDEGIKEWALRSVATAVADIDPDRAERIAWSIPNEHEKALALLDVVMAVADIDPDRAERIARSIRLENDKAVALSRVAAAVAATAPDRAALLLADAERLDQSDTTGRAWRDAHRVQVAVALAATDPDRGERIVGSLPASEWNHEKDRAVGQFAEGVAASYPDRAERIALSIPDKDFKEIALRNVAVAVAATDPDRAERIVGSITDEGIKEWALRSVAEAVADIDPDRAERIAQLITTPQTKVELLLAISNVCRSPVPEA
jgi:Caspase domain